MAKREMESGATGDRTARNLAEVRESRHMSQGELGERLTELGRPMSASVVSKTEKQDRRIDVDDLVAFAVALGVTPNRLLLAAAASDGRPVELLPELRVSELKAWQWATGDTPLPTDAAPPSLRGLPPDARELIFRRENHPNNVGRFGFGPSEIGEIMRMHPEWVRVITTTVSELQRRGLYPSQLARIIKGMDQLGLFLDDERT